MEPSLSGCTASTSGFHAASISGEPARTTSRADGGLLCSMASASAYERHARKAATSWPLQESFRKRMTSDRLVMPYRACSCSCWSGESSAKAIVSIGSRASSQPSRSSRTRASLLATLLSSRNCSARGSGAAPPFVVRRSSGSGWRLGRQCSSRERTPSAKSSRSSRVERTKTPTMPRLPSISSESSLYESGGASAEERACCALMSSRASSETRASSLPPTSTMLPLASAIMLCSVLAK
mmetsp:Transcript_24785/g.57760  ORF Transcript_24785/g.57760 Transcript_24785/m.57760 type:complete len:239 (+) Transcript_24785:1424-2140(+)